MPLTAAEKMRKYRERLKEDPVKKEAYLTRERQQWKHRRETGKEKVISELSDRDKRYKRKMRREAQKRFRIRRQQQQEARTETAPVSDPTISSTAAHSATTVVQPCSTDRSRRRSRVLRDRAKAYRKITALEATLEETKRLCERYRKWCQRLTKVGPHNVQNEDLVNSTPRTKTKLMLRKERVSSHVITAVP